MAILQINEHEIDVDIQAELEEFTWENATWTPTKLIACSPFREDSHPSFYCFLEDDPRTEAKAGYWGDSGGSGTYEKGGFLSLLSFLRQETVEETIEYLIDKYGLEESGQLQLKKLHVSHEYHTRQTLDSSLLSNLEDHPYLLNRGITQAIQKALDVGFNRRSNTVVIPWYLPDGRLANIKYRRVDSKRFYYQKGGWPISKLLYGIDILHKKEYLKTVVITEAEIDSMSCMVAGFPSVASGGSKWSKDKRDLLLRTNVNEIIIATDRDEAGQKLSNDITESLKDRMTIRKVNFPSDCKDCNDVLIKHGSAALKQMIEGSEVVSSGFNLNLKLR